MHQIRELEEESGLSLKPNQLKFCAHTIRYHPELNRSMTDTLFRAVINEMIPPKSNWEGECAWYKIDQLETEKIISSATKNYDFVFDKSNTKNMFTYAEYSNDEFKNIKTTII